MLSAPQIKTDRLLLRRWRESDLHQFAELNQDDFVMQHFPNKLTHQESNAMVERIEKAFEENGFGLYAVETNGSEEFIGFVGLSVPRFEAAFTPCVEIGWRLAHKHWGYGYAAEAAEAVLADGFMRVGLPEIVSFTAACNKNSIRVMEKLGMHRQIEDDFLHPSLADDHPLKPHVLYRINNRNG
ncbi:GNAT family N-acetyltransferase [soil metagenome]